jgi:hypothetical protein
VALGAGLAAFPSVGDREYEVDQTTAMVQTVHLVVASSDRLKSWMIHSRDSLRT